MTEKYPQPPVDDSAPQALERSIPPADDVDDGDDDGDHGDDHGDHTPSRRARYVLSLAFRPAGRIHRVIVDPRRFDLHTGDLVVVETDRGLSIARVLCNIAELVGDVELSRHVRKVVRPAREPDLLTHAEGVAREPELLAAVREIVGTSGQDIQVADVTFQAVGSKLTVYFVSEKRIDFRGLVKELSGQLRLRIEMRQVGVRDEAKLHGGLAHCGRELCCSTWLHAFAGVSIRQAKDQNLALSPNKISGLCGRLMCCLSYEHEHYADLRKSLPKTGKRVLTSSGPGKVVSMDILRQRMLFIGDDGTRQQIGPEDLIRDEDGRPVRPPLPEPWGRSGPDGPDRRPAPGPRPAPRGETNRPAAGEPRPAQDDRPRPAGSTGRAERRADSDGDQTTGGDQSGGTNDRSRRSRRGRGRGRRKTGDQASRDGKE